MKKFGIAAVAALLAVVLGTSLVGNAPKANADVTDVRNIHCLLLIGIIDGDPNDAVDTATDGPAACGTQFLPGDPANAAAQPGTIVGIAREIGDEDSVLEPSDFDEFDGYDGNQLSEACTTAALLCTNLIFAFVDDEAPVSIDITAGPVTVQNGLEDYTCNTDGTGLGQDNDCSDAVTDNNDGVVVFHVINGAQPGGSDRGDEETAVVRQDDVEQSVDINVVGSPNDVVLTLVETTIQTSGSVAEADDCAEDTPADDAIDPANATLAFAEVFDEDDRPLTMVSVVLSVDPPGDDPDIATLGQGNDVEGIVSDSGLSIVTDVEGAPIAHYIVVCGGSGTGETEIKAQIDDGDADFLADDDTSRVALTVIGAPANVALAAVPAEIQCDGSQTATVTATITDSDGNAVVAGVPVNFTVVALGTANPINTVTDENGQASSVITPLSNSSAGVTVIVTAGSSSIATPVQTSTRVDCALPLDTQPTLTPPGGGGGPISPPDTGNGGYLGQDSGSNAGLLIALAAVAGTVVFAGGLVARRAGK